MCSTRKFGVGLLLALAMLGSGAVRPAAASGTARTPTLFGEVSGGQVAANSAMSATAFVLRYFHQPVHMRRLARQFRVGRTWQRRFQQPEMIQNLTGYGAIWITTKYEQSQ